MRRASDGSIDAGEMAAVGFVPGPDLGWNVRSLIIHEHYRLFDADCQPPPNA